MLVSLIPYRYLHRDGLMYCRNYLLAQAHVDAPALGSSIANLNPTATFTPLQPLQDTDVDGFIRHAHEQNLIATIEARRKKTQEDFYRFLEQKQTQEWEERKKRIYDAIGNKSGTENKAVDELKRSRHGKSLLAVSLLVWNSESPGN